MTLAAIVHLVAVPTIEWLFTTSCLFEYNMDPAEQEEVIAQILQKNPDNSKILLNKLGLYGLPSREQVHHEIEAKLLLPRERLPDHWLPTYQMYQTITIVSYILC